MLHWSVTPISEIIGQTDTILQDVGFFNHTNFGAITKNVLVHTSRDSSDMPLGRIFTQDDPYFLGGQDLAKGYQKYVDKHSIVSAIRNSGLPLL
jgi:hypothetical protein